MSPDNVEFPLPEKELIVVAGVPCDVDCGTGCAVRTAAGAPWMNRRHDPVHPVPQFVPGAQSDKVLLFPKPLILTVAYKFAPRLLAPSPFVR